jgi:hypothetical protein
MFIRVTLMPRAIRRELARLDAGDVRYRNLGDGYGLLEPGPDGSDRPRKSREILDRLQALPDGAGSAALWSAFGDRRSDRADEPQLPRGPGGE